MAISIIGSGSGNNITNTDITLTFSPAPTAGDITVIYGGFGTGTTQPAGPVTSGYTLIASHSAANPHFGVWYKVQSGSTDANVVGNSSGNAANGTAYGYYILRGVDTSTPLDTTRTVAGPTTSTNPDPPAITTVTAGAYVVAHAGSAVNDAARGTVTGYTIITGNTANDTGVDFSTEAAWSASVNPVTADPPVWNAWASGANYRITVAWRASVAAATARMYLLFCEDGDEIV